MAKRKKVQKDKQRSTKHTHKTKDRVTNTNPTKTEGELMCSGKVGISCSTSDIRRVNLSNWVYLLPWTINTTSALLVPTLLVASHV